MAERSVQAIVQDAASGEWNIPEFQRQFEWKHEQVAQLYNSLYENLPIGLLTVWKTGQYNEPQSLPPSGRIPLWIVDGQQRITSFCVLSGRKPYWMNDREWREALKKRIYLNINENGDAKVGRPTKNVKLQLSLDELVNRTAGEAQRYVQAKCSEAGIIESEKAADLAVNARCILDRAIHVAEVGEDKAVEEIAELYRRLNRLGTRLRQAQIMLAYVSQYNPGWVREEFYPYLEDLTDSKWELDPAHVLQVAAIVAEGRARVGQASEPMWQVKVTQMWPHLRDVIDTSILQLWDKGITDEDMIPSSYTLITLFALQAKFINTPDYDFNRVFKWFVLANLEGRYGDAPLETLTKDGSIIYGASNSQEALDEMVIPWTKGDLHTLVDAAFKDNSTQALILHMLLWESQAKDWVQHVGIPTLAQAPRSLEPHWHHILPKRWGRNHGYDDCSKTGNVTRICGETNVRKLGSKPPWEYVPEFNISKDELTEHLIPDEYAEKFTRGQLLSPGEFKDFVRKRGELIVERGASLLGL